MVRDRDNANRLVRVMTLRTRFGELAILLLACWTGTIAYGQSAIEIVDLEHPAIGYRTSSPIDAVTVLNGRLQNGEQQLPFDNTTGYLKSLLEALDVPVESQILVYSKTSLQQARISPDNPRAIFFNDSVAVAWVPGGFIEVAVHSPHHGGVFYLLPQTPTAIPQLSRDDRCLTCHYTTAAQGVPGFILRSIPTATNGTTMPWLGNYTTDHRSRIEERWGGWYVTGDGGSTTHLGNLIITNPNAQGLPSSANRGGSTVSTLGARVNSEYYLSPHSDIVALLVFDHQARMMNLLIRIGWEARVFAYESQAAPSDNVLRDRAVELVDYLLFIDEAPLDGVRSMSPFAKTFSARGPRDRYGRALRDLDLQHRLMRYPCSYMIYSAAFDSLPAAAKDAIYRRLWQVLSGEDRSAKYSRLSQEDRRAIVEILRDTKQDLPSYFVVS